MVAAMAARSGGEEGMKQLHRLILRRHLSMIDDEDLDWCFRRFQLESELFLRQSLGSSGSVTPLAVTSEPGRESCDVVRNLPWIPSFDGSRAIRISER
jgi:hypothetical protein